MNEVKEKTEYQKMMDSRILSIEADIGDYLEKNNNKEPECIIIGVTTIEELLQYLHIEVTNWKEPVAVEIGGIPLRVFRTLDLQYGHYFIR